MFGIRAPFSTTTSHNEKIVRLLKSVTLGSNGARYKHVGIESRIIQLYNPLYLNLQVRDKLIANVTFCRREKDWYIRYFAFDNFFQSTTNKKMKSRSNGSLTKQLNDFFKKAIEAESEPEQFYAYIDPKNQRSLWMSETFGFRSVATIATQTFSRLHPKNQSVEKLSDRSQIEDFLNVKFKDRPFYHPYQTFNKTPFYVLKKKGEVVAFAKAHRAEWSIEQLPGRGGKVLTKLVPYIPVINKVIRPSSHRFSVIDSVWVKDHETEYFEQLAEGILASEENKVLHWWVDRKEPLWRSLSKKTNWGLLHKINGVHNVSLVVKGKGVKELQNPAYISGFDFI